MPGTGEPVEYFQVDSDGVMRVFDHDNAEDSVEVSKESMAIV